MSVLEAVNKQVLEDPRGHIIDQSGKVWLLNTQC
jgi:hypothetical protein